MSRFRPVLTVDQYREGARLFQVEVATLAWSLVVSPAAVNRPRQWRPLTAEQSAELFDGLLMACTRFASKDKARVVP